MVFGGKVGRVKFRYGKVSFVKYDGKGVLRGIKNLLIVGRYYFFVVLEVLREFDVSVVFFDDNVVMGIRYRKFLIEGF